MHEANVNSGTAETKKKGKKRWIAAAGIVLALAVTAGFLLKSGGGSVKKPLPQQTGSNSGYTEKAVERRDITSTITGSGFLEAANNYSVTTLALGNILTDTFEEGDMVEEDMVLYTIDSSDVSTNLEQAEISHRQSQRSYEKKLEALEDLTVITKKPGCVTELLVEVGDEVKAGQTIAKVQEIDTMTLVVPFPSDEAVHFTVGQSAAVTLDSTFETLSGTVSEIAPLDTVLQGNRIVRNVTVLVKNPGGLSLSQTATADIGGSLSTSGGTFAYGEEHAVNALVAGEVSQLLVKEGDRITGGTKVAILTSETLDDEIEAARDSLRNSEISLQNRYDQLDNYTIKSPISGMVIDKFYKAGETTEQNKVLCTIYDLSYLTMTLDVDELDISNIHVGQTVSVTADAVEDKIYEGTVTKVSVAGTYSNGVTTYPVTIRLDETEGLLPGMNVSAEIVLSRAESVLTIPTTALLRGGRVLVTADSPSAKHGKPSEILGAAGEPYVTVEVQTGLADDDNVQIVSGLTEGDTVAYVSSMGSGRDMGMMGMMPGMPGMGGMGGMGSQRYDGGGRQSGARG